MEDSILKSTKKILGIQDEYTAFDLDIITHLNSTFSVLSQLGVGPIYGFSIEDDQATWSDIHLPRNQLNMVRTYVFLKVRMLFDPPATSFLIEATNKQIEEHEVRLSYFREDLIPNSILEVTSGNWSGDPLSPVDDNEINWLFVYNQTIPSMTWVVEHNLGLNPSVVTADTDGDIIQGTVQFDSLNQLTITFAEPITGTVYLS